MKSILALFFAVAFTTIAEAYTWTYTQAYPAFWDKTATSAVETDFDVDTGAKPAVVLNNGFALTVNGGNITSAAATGTIYMKDGSSLVLSNCTVSNTNDKNYGAAAIYVEPGAMVSITINGATLSGQWGIDLQGAGSTITMSSGTINAGEYGILIQGADTNLNISGGNIANIVRTSAGSVATKVTGGAYAALLATTYYDNTKSEFSYGSAPYLYVLGEIVPKGFEVEVVDGVAMDVVDAKPPANVVGTVGYATTLKIGSETKPTTTETTPNVNAAEVFGQMEKSGAKVATVTVQATDEEGQKGEEVIQAYIEVESSAKETTIAVPFKGMKVDDILETSELSEGDEISIYNPTSGKYQTFELNSDKKWVSTDPSGVGITTVAQGSSVILTRNDKTSKIRMKGQVAKAGTTVQTAKKPAAGAQSTYTESIINPQTEDMNLTTTMTGTPKQFSGSIVGDELLVQQEDGSYKTYRYTAEGWATVTRTVVNGRPKTVTTKEDPVVKPGRSFFYRSNGGAPKFTK